MNPRVKKVIPKGDFTLQLVFTNDEVKLFDAKPYLSIGIFKELQEPSLFNTATAQLGTVIWKNGQDLCPDTLYLESKLLEK
jgi:hypothetical protein